MQRMVLLAVLAGLLVLGGCASRDPNLVVRGLAEHPRAAADYTLRVNLYDLDEKGHARLVKADDPSLRGFVTRTLAAKGYRLKASGPAAYDVDVHLLCGDMRRADMSFVTEQIPVPAEANARPGGGDVFYWLPERATTPGLSGQEAHDRRASLTSRRPTQNPQGGAPLGGQSPDFCQGRVLVTLTPASAGPAHEIFVSRAATDDCQAVPGCPASACRSALEQSLVGILETRF